MADLTPDFSALTATVGELVHARMVVFSLWDGVDKLVPQPGAFGIPPALLGRLHTPCRPEGSGLSEQIVFHDHPFRGWYTDGAEFRPYRSAIEALEAVDTIACAWKAGERRLGIAAAINSSRPGGFTEGDLAVLQIAAMAAGLVWQQEEARREQAELVKRLLELAAEERRQVARGIHDDSLQMLAAVQLRIEVLRRKLHQPADREALNALAQMVELSMAGQRGLVSSLWPEVLKPQRPGARRS